MNILPGHALRKKKGKRLKTKAKKIAGSFVPIESNVFARSSRSENDVYSLSRFIGTLCNVIV
jgi:hypothetical protein